jgi:hypothetical protein
MTSFVMSSWSVELEHEVERWLDSLPPDQFAAAASRIDCLAEKGASLRMPRSRSLGAGLFELRFDLGRNAQRITFFFPGERRVVLLTAFHKQRQNERAEVDRARQAMKVCIEQGHTAEEDA